MLSILIILAASGASPPAMQSVEGRWTNPKRNVVLKLAPCGSELCGTVEWASRKAIEDARRGGTRSLIGAQVMSGFKPDGAGNFKGRATDPKRGLRGSATIRLTSSDTLQVKGCAVGGLMCREQQWKRLL